MIIAGWILWGVACAWFLFACIAFLTELFRPDPFAQPLDVQLFPDSSESYLSTNQKRVISGLYVTGMIAALAVTAIFNVSKFHLLWFVPFFHCFGTQWVLMLWRIMRKHRSDDTTSADRLICNALIAAIIAGVLDLIADITNFYEIMTEVDLGYWAFVVQNTFDVYYFGGILGIILSFGLAFGIYKKSRICAIFLFAYCLCSGAITIASGQRTDSIAVNVLTVGLLYFFLEGIRGAFKHHKITISEVTQSRQCNRSEMKDSDDSKESVQELKIRVDIDEVWKKFHETHEDSYFSLLIEYYQPLVRYVAERLHNKLSDKIELDDLIRTGIVGLRNSISAFEPERGVKFETYCTPRIKGAILDELRNVLGNSGDFGDRKE